MRPPELGLLDQLPDNNHQRKDRQLDVITDKVDGAEPALEATPTLHEDKEAVEHHRNDGTPGVSPVLERKKVLLPLCPQAGAEPQRRDADGDPGQLVRHADDVLQPCPQLSRADEGRAEEKARDKARGEHGDPGDLEPGETSEDRRGVPVCAEGEEQPGPGEEGMVAGGDYAREDDGVDEGARDLGPGHCECDGEGRGVRGLCVEIGVVVGDVEADHKRGQDVEEQDPPEDVLDDPRQHAGRVSSLARRDGDGLGAAVGERSRYEDGGEAADATDEGRVTNMPVPTADIGVVRVSPDVDGYAQDDENNNGHDFEQAEPVLELAVRPHVNNVGQHEDHPHDQAQRVPGKRVGPVLQEELQGDQVRSRRHGVVEPVVPREGETKCVVHIAARERAERAGHGHVCRHLAEAKHGSKHNCSNNGVTNEQRGRAAGRQGLARAEEKARADGAADGDHLDLPRREGSAKLVLVDMAVVILERGW